jgi:glycosyltransferase involved in cell wall biosynthesis
MRLISQGPTERAMLGKDQQAGPKIAVILPCRNEGAAIRHVVEDFKQHLPSAKIYVYDNNSDDNTALDARRAGAVIRREKMQGKGYVIRRAFSEVDADVYVIADGDGTYDPSAAPEFVRRLWSDRLDMVVGVRQHSDKSAYRIGHTFGNRVFNKLISSFFRKGYRDIFSGYRALSRPFVKSFPSFATGFEIETEMTVHALQLELPIDEIPTRYSPRPAGTASKLRTLPDGLSILASVFLLLKHHRPFLVFGVTAITAAALSLAIGVPIVLEFAETGLVPRFPSAILAASLMVIAVISLTAGIILASVARLAREQRRLFYLMVRRSDMEATSPQHFR